MLPPPFRYIGGKWKLASWIVQHIPPHTTWIEVFGGAASVTLSKPRSQIEIYNDLNRHVVEFFLALRDHREALIEKIKRTPYSRSLYEEWTRAFNQHPPDDLIERVAQWYYIQRASFAGKFGAGFAASGSRKSGYWSAIEGLEVVAERFKYVVIECLDWQKCLQIYDGPEVAFYLDPTYLDCDDENRFMSGTIDHRELAESLHHLKGKALLSHCEHPVIADLYKDFHKVERSVAVDADGKVRQMKGTPRMKRTEWLLMNFETPRGLL